MRNQDLIKGISTDERKVLSDIRIREKLAWACVVIICFSTAATYAILFFVGFGIMCLPEGLLNWLGAATVGTIISNIMIVFRGMFLPQSDKNQDADSDS